MLANLLNVGLADAAAGVHELVAMNLFAHAAARGDFEVIVVDTARMASEAAAARRVVELRYGWEPRAEELRAICAEASRR